MRVSHLLSTTAAIVLIGGGIAAAQDVKKDETPARAPAAQQHAPAEKVAPSMAQHPTKPHETTGQGSAMAPNAEHRDRDVTPRAAEKDMKSEKSGEKAEMKNGANGENKSASEKTEHRSTTGQGAAGAARLSSEQRTKITTIIHKHKVAPVHLNVSISVGTRIPEHVHLYPLPVEVIAVYPEWRGYDYILVGDEILVINPDSHEIVAILEA